MKTIRYALFALACATALLRGSTPSADQLLDDAKTTASKAGKTIFVHFGASWCGWCKRLDAFLARPEVTPVFTKYFVPVTVVVQENEKNKALENPGGAELFKRLGGPDGLPYLAFLDAKGNLIINSKREGRNIGFPFEPEEIAWFVKMMKQAAPTMADDELKLLQDTLDSIRESLKKPAKS